MRLCVFIAVAVTLVHADPHPVRPFAGRGELKVDSYLYRPDGLGVGSRGMGFRGSGGARYSLMGGYDVEEDNGERFVEQEYADLLRQRAAIAAAEANTAAGSLRLRQKAGNAAAPALNGGVTVASQAVSVGTGNAVAEGGVGFGDIAAGVLGSNCREGQAIALGGVNIQGSNAVNLAQGVAAAGYQGGFGIGEQGYQLTGLEQASSAQAQGVVQNLRSQGNAAGQAVLGSGKLATEQNVGGLAGLQAIASTAAALGGSQVIDEYSRYGAYADYSGQGGYASSFGNGLASGNAQESLEGANTVYAGHDEGALINSYMSGVSNEGRIRYAGLATNVASGGTGFGGGAAGGLSLGIGANSEGAGSLNVGDSGAGFGYGQGLHSGSFHGQGDLSQSSLVSGGNAGQAAYGGIQSSAALKVDGGQLSQNFISGYGGHSEGTLVSSGQGVAVQGGYSGASLGQESVGGYLAVGGQAGYGGGVASNVGGEGGHYEQILSGFSDGHGGVSGEGLASAGLGIGGQANYGFAGTGLSLSAQGHSGALATSGVGQIFGSRILGGHGGSGGANGISYAGLIGGGNSGSGYHIGQGVRGASSDFSGIRYASGTGHATHFAAQNAAHVQGVGSAVKHLVVAEGHEDHYYGHPKYHFEYAVNDPYTGDIKNQWESRDGGVVKGAYSLHDPDGTVRTVEYEANKENGFNAVVKKTGGAVHPSTH